MVSIKNIVLLIPWFQLFVKTGFSNAKKEGFIWKLFESLPRDKYIYFLMGSRKKKHFSLKLFSILILFRLQNWSLRRHLADKLNIIRLKSSIKYTIYISGGLTGDMGWHPPPWKLRVWWLQRRNYQKKTQERAYFSRKLSTYFAYNCYAISPLALQINRYFRYKYFRH